MLLLLPWTLPSGTLGSSMSQKDPELGLQQACLGGLPDFVSARFKKKKKKKWWGGPWGDFHGGPVIKNPPANRENGFDPWSGKIPHAAGQLNPSATTTE